MLARFRPPPARWRRRPPQPRWRRRTAPSGAGTLRCRWLVSVNKAWCSVSLLGCRSADHRGGRKIDDPGEQLKEFLVVVDREAWVAVAGEGGADLQPVL